MSLPRILSDISKERARQLQKWGIQTHSPERWLTILVEEVGEVAKAIQTDPGTDEISIVVSALAYRAELVQVAAVAAAAIEQIDNEIGALSD